MTSPVKAAAALAAIAIPSSGASNNDPTGSSNNNNNRAASPATPSRLTSGPSSSSSFISELIASSLPSQSVEGAKQALSLRTTTMQFTRFVQKAGPVFAVSDGIEGILRWQDPLQTLLAAAIWAIVSLYPHTLLLVPSVTITSLLLVNHQRRFPPANQLDTSDGRSPARSFSSASSVKPPVSGQPPSEGSVDYFHNLQNIQELMGRVADLTDAGRSLVPYFNWSDPQLSTVILQLSSGITLLLAAALYFMAPFMDMRYVFLALGEATILACHPFSVSLLSALRASPSSRALARKYGTLLDQFLADDALPDEIILPNRKGQRRIIKEIEVYEHEGRGLDGVWSIDALKAERGERPWVVLIDKQEISAGAGSTTSNITSQPVLLKSQTNTLTTSAGPRSSPAAYSGVAEDRAAPPRTSTRIGGSSSSSDSASSQVSYSSLSTIVPPRGFAFIQGPLEEWKIDVLGEWNSPYGVDAAGWAFKDNDFQDLGVDPLQKAGERKGAARRTRRWFRRMVSVPTYD